MNFACELVHREVQFGWNEVDSGLDPTGSPAQPEQVVCSGIGLAQCPVRDAPGGPAGWETCPRMQRLASRLRNAIQHAS